MWSFAVTKVSKKRQVLAQSGASPLSAGKTARRPDPDDGRTDPSRNAGDKSQSREGRCNRQRAGATQTTRPAATIARSDSTNHLL